MAGPFLNYDWPNPVIQKSLRGALTWGPGPINVVLNNYLYSTKFQGLAVLATPQNAATATKFEGLAILATPQNAATATKFVGYYIFIEKPLFNWMPLPPRKLRPLPPDLFPNLVLFAPALAAKPPFNWMDLPPRRLPRSMPEGGALNPNLFPPQIQAPPFSHAMGLPLRARARFSVEAYQNFALLQGPAPSGAPFTYVMELPPREAVVLLPEFAPLNLNVFPPPVPVVLEIGEHIAIRDAYSLRSIAALALVERFSISDGIAVATAPPSGTGIRLHIPVLDPRPMEVEHWSRMVAESLLQVGYVPAWTDEAGWLHWASQVKSLPVLSGWQLPDPRGFGTWREWVFRFNETVLNNS